MNNVKDEKEIVREMIRHEDDMMNHRITWLTTIQGLLFAALGFSWDKEVCLVYLLSAVGVLAALSSLVALNCTHQAVKRLYTGCAGCRKDNQKLSYPDVIGWWDDSIMVRHLPTWVTLPIIFIVSWIVLGGAVFYAKGFPCLNIFGKSTTICYYIIA